MAGKKGPLGRVADAVAGAAEAVDEYVVQPVEGALGLAPDPKPQPKAARKAERKAAVARTLAKKRVARAEARKRAAGG
jgi:hypothetical protein